VKIWFKDKYDNHDIVCNNVAKLCTHVYLGMDNIVAKYFFQFYYTKIFIFYFVSCKNGCFRSMYSLKKYGANLDHHNFKNIDHIL
jgi:hypothetical protein